MAIYHVQTPNSEHLVKAQNAKQAIAHVIAGTVKAKALNAEESAELAGRLKLESAAAEQAPEPDKTEEALSKVDAALKGA